jgi:hypothetical protein
MPGPSRRIGDRFPFKIPAVRYSEEYYQCMDWCNLQSVEYLTDYMYWRGSLRFKDEGLATMCKLAASVA